MDHTAPRLIDHGSAASHDTEGEVELLVERWCIARIKTAEIVEYSCA